MKKGFTLAEIVVTVAIMSVLIILISYIRTSGQTYIPYSIDSQKQSLNESKKLESGWSTYVDEERGYRFEYPETAKVFDNKIVLAETHFFEDPHFYDANIINIQLSNEEKQGVDGNLEEAIFDKYNSGVFKLEKIITKNNTTILLNKEQSQALAISGNDVYTISFLRRNPLFRTGLTDEQLKVVVETYEDGYSVFERVYSTFEVLD